MIQAIAALAAILAAAAALFFGATELRRANRDRRAVQARQVYAWYHRDSAGDVFLKVQNGSSMPVFSVQTPADFLTHPSHEVARILRPGQVATAGPFPAWKVLQKPHERPCQVVFIDAGGFHWRFFGDEGIPADPQNRAFRRSTQTVVRVTKRDLDGTETYARRAH